MSVNCNSQHQSEPACLENYHSCRLRTSHSKYLFISSTANTFRYCCASEPVHCFYSQQHNLIQRKAILELHRTISLERIQYRLCIGVYKVRCLARHCFYARAAFFNGGSATIGGPPQLRRGPAKYCLISIFSGEK